MLSVGGARQWEAHDANGLSLNAPDCAAGGGYKICNGRHQKEYLTQHRFIWIGEPRRPAFVVVVACRVANALTDAMDALMAQLMNKKAHIA